MYGSVDYTQLVPLIFFSLYNIISYYSFTMHFERNVHWPSVLHDVICNYVPFVAAIIALTLRVVPYIIRIFFKVSVKKNEVPTEKKF